MSILKSTIKHYALVGLSVTALLSPSLFAEGITVDNSDPSVIKNGIWSVSGGANPYGQDSEYAPEPTASIQWPLSVPRAGRYEVQAHWTEWANRTSQANYLISNGSVSDTVTVDQKQRGGQWVTLGDYDLIAGDLNITLTNGNGGTLSGDAVRIVGPLGPIVRTNVVVVDNGDNTVTRQGGWAPSSGANPYDGASEFTTTGTFGWEATLPDAGQYIVEAYWTYFSNRTDQAAYEIQHATGVDTVTVDQKENGGEWVELGVYDFNSGAANILLSNATGTGTLSADAVRFTKVYLSDNIDSQQNTGEFLPVMNDNLDISSFLPVIKGYGEDIVLRQEVIDNAGGQLGPPGTRVIADFSWETQLPESQAYDIQVFIPLVNGPAYGNYLVGPTTNTPLTSEVQFDIEGHASQLVVEWPYETAGAGAWYSLGVYNLESGAHRVTQSVDCDYCSMLVDAIRYVPTDAEPVEEGLEILYFDNQGSNVEREGFWARSGGANPYDGHSEYTMNGEFTWNITIPDGPEVDAYDFQVYWTGYSNRTTNAVYTVTGSYDDGNYGPPGTRYSYRVDVDQTQNGGEWVSLGAYSLAEAQVSVRNESGGTLSADAIRLIPLKSSSENSRRLESISKECSVSDSNHAGDHVEVIEGDDQSITLNILETGESLLINPASELTDIPLYRGYFIRENRELWYSINDNRQVIISWLDKHLRFFEGGANPYENTRYVLHTKIVDLDSGAIKTHLRELGTHYQVRIRTRVFCDDGFIHLDTHAINFGTGAIYDTRMHSFNPNFMPMQELELQYDNGPFFYEPFNPFRI